jgi:hypothetical protein
VVRRKPDRIGGSVSQALVNCIRADLSLHHTDMNEQTERDKGT